MQREIEIFKEMGRGDQVLALLTEGEPSDSFPSQMLERERKLVGADGSVTVVKEDTEPLAADVRASRHESMTRLKRFALLRLIACILGLKFDDLRKRELERERHRRMVIIAAGAAALIVLGAAGLGYRQMLQPTTSYYRQVVWRWGVPEGLGPIGEETRSHLETSYAVTRQRLGLMQHPRVVEVRRQSSVGTPRDYGVDLDYEPGHARLVLHYSSDGAVSSIDAFSVTDRLLRQYAFDWDPREKNQAVVTYKLGAVEVAQSATSKLLIDWSVSSVQQNQARTDITKNRFTFDNNGFIVQRSFLNNTGDPRHDAQNSYGERYQHTPEGLVSRRANIGVDGNEIALQSGSYAVVSMYGPDYELIREIVIGPDGNPFNGAEGFAYLTREYDSVGERYRHKLLQP